MTRRLALILALLSPLAGSAQTAGAVLITPNAFGPTDCTSTTASVNLSWTSSGTFVAGDTFSVYVHNAESCPATGTPAGTMLVTGLAATTASGSYPTTGTLTRRDFISKAGLSACGGGTIHVCAQHWPVAGTTGTAKGTATGSADLVVAPASVPINVTVAPGDSALFVSWADGADSAIAAVSYNVTAVSTTPPETHTASFTSRSNQRMSGLTNGVTYTVTVTSVSAGGIESGPSLTVVTGTPSPVSGFWEQYAGQDHREQGGCGGGAAGLFSLLGVAMALRGLRRRS